MQNPWQLQTTAIEACHRRGHAMSRWIMLKHNARTYYRATCEICKMYVDVRPEPQPNEIDIGGTAVALNCNTLEEDDMSKVFKFVTPYRDGGTSITTVHYAWYHPEKETFPEFGKLFAFDSVLNAEKFYASLSNPFFLDLWEAQATNVEKPNIIHIPEFSAHYEQFWENRRICPRQIRRRMIPLGTVFCDSIRITKRIRSFPQ